MCSGQQQVSKKLEGIPTSRPQQGGIVQVSCEYVTSIDADRQVIYTHGKKV